MFALRTNLGRTFTKGGENMKICRHDEGNITKLRQKRRSPLDSKTATYKRKRPSYESLLSVGARGFEPPTSCTPCKRASRAAVDRLQSRFYDVMHLRLSVEINYVSALRLPERGQK